MAIGKAVIAPITTGATSITKTLLQILAGTNHAIEITGIEMTFDGVANLGEHVQVEVLRQTDAGTGSGLTPVKMGQASTALDTSAQEAFTPASPSAEPTAGDVLYRWFVHPQGGVIYNPVEPGECVVPGGGRLGVRTITPAGHTACDANVSLTWKE